MRYLNVFKGRVNDLIVVWEAVELQCLQIEVDMVPYLWCAHLSNRGIYSGTRGGGRGHTCTLWV